MQTETTIDAENEVFEHRHHKSRNMPTARHTGRHIRKGRLGIELNAKTILSVQRGLLHLVLVARGYFREFEDKIRAVKN